MEYVSLAKTRLNDLKESLEDMGLYEDVSAAGRASAQPQCPAVQDVERAVSLFETTGRISATVMEASIFRRPYFLTRFLPALLIPRMLPVKADARMRLIEALKKADKIPAAQFSSYVESCRRQRQQDRGSVCLDTSNDPVEVLRVQLQEFRGLVVGGADGDIMSQLSMISHTLSTIFPAGPDDVTELLVITVGLDSPPSPELHVTVVNMILTNFCQCLLDACRANPPNKQSLWASRFVSVLVSNRQLVSGLVHRLWELFNNQGSSLSPAHVLGLAALVVHLHASMSHSPLVQLQPPVLSTAVSVGDALGSALMCRTSSDMTFTVRLCVAAVSYGTCRGNSQQQDYVPSSFYKKLFYLIPRLMPEVRRSTPASGDAAVDESSEADLPELWSSVTDSSSSWRSTASRLWLNSELQLRQRSQQGQLSLTEWLHHELRVQRSDDVLTDPQRQEYQQWACQEFYCPRPVEHGGCGGDMEILCSHLLDAVMDQPSSDLLLQRLDHRASCLRGSCLPDIMSRLQEFLCEFKLTNVQSHQSSRADVCDFLFDFVSRRFSSTGSSELHLQHTLDTWNRVLLSLPPLLLVKVRSEGGRKTVDCSRLIQHINQHQRISCSAVGFLSFHLTAHFFRALFCASVCCEQRREEVNKSWSQISEQCPLLLTSAVLWWQPLSAMLSSLWSGVGEEEPLPEKLQLITDCQHWANSVVTSSWSQSMPSAPALLLASCLYQCCRSPGQNRQNFSSALNLLRPERGAQCRQVLVYLFFICVNRFLSALLYPKQKNKENLLLLCSDLLSVLVDSSEWLLVFTPSAEGGVYQSVNLMTSDDLSRMMPWGFYRLLLHQNTELQQRALQCPGYIHTAALCYIRLLQLFLEGQTLTDPQTEEQQILTQAKMHVLKVISQAPPAALSSAQLRRLEAQCSDLDPEVAAALSLHLDPPDLSPEMDFL
uniref:Fanconi anemia complementation group A n=2 Tax=Cynoglossus semilaevis TaxID=244447 RepID=A0A3P8X7F7_CYNSE